jgi:hypothetical protein
MKSRLHDVRGAGHRLLLVSLLLGAGTFAQNAPPPSALENPQELNGKIELLTRSLQQTQTELARSRTEIEQLRATLEQVLKPRPCNRRKRLARHRFRKTIGTC